MFSSRKDDMINIYVDDTERRIIVRALADLREKQKAQNKHHDFLDDLIIKVCDADKAHMKSYERSETR